MSIKHHLTLPVPAELPQVLLDWYRVNARDLPWRHTYDPYRIWISEIMLQQTRVAAVIEYYHRFLTAFPTVEALAKAPEEQVLKLWEGLGYYSRARNLQRAAQQIAENKFPEDYAGLLTLPGIGEYTAGAIASAAFGKPVAAVDGNILRVAARVTDCHENILLPNTKKVVQNWVLSMMPKQEADIRIFNQALMELGAVLCVPKGNLACENCPVQELCLGRRYGTAETLPCRERKKERRTETLTVFLLIRDGRIALRKRPARGLLASLWEFPNIFGSLTPDEAANLLSSWNLVPQNWRNRLNARHLFTHIEWQMRGYTIEVSGKGSDSFIWVTQAELNNYAVPSAFSRYYQETVNILSEK